MLEKQIGVFLPAVLLVPLLGAFRAPRAVALRRAALALAPFAVCFSALPGAQPARVRLPGLPHVSDSADRTRGGLGGRVSHPSRDARRGGDARLDRSSQRAEVRACGSSESSRARSWGFRCRAAGEAFPSSNLDHRAGLREPRPARSRAPVVRAAVRAVHGRRAAARLRNVARADPLLRVSRAAAGRRPRGCRDAGGARRGRRLAALAASRRRAGGRARRARAERRQPRAQRARSGFGARSALRRRRPAATRSPGSEATRQPATAWSASIPGRVAWEADRPGIMAPAGGVRAIETVVRHYDARFLVLAVDVRPRRDAPRPARVRREPARRSAQRAGLRRHTL